MRELTLKEVVTINGGHDVAQSEHSYQAEFWNAFLHSSGFAAGIFWSPIMPFIMGIAAVGSGIFSAIQVVGSGVGQGIGYLASSAYTTVRG